MTLKKAAEYRSQLDELDGLTANKKIQDDCKYHFFCSGVHEYLVLLVSKSVYKICKKLQTNVTYDYVQGFTVGALAEIYILRRKRYEAGLPEGTFFYTNAEYSKYSYFVLNIIRRVKHALFLEIYGARKVQPTHEQINEDVFLYEESFIAKYEHLLDNTKLTQNAIDYLAAECAVVRGPKWRNVKKHNMAALKMALGYEISEREASRHIVIGSQSGNVSIRYNNKLAQKTKSVCINEGIGYAAMQITKYKIQTEGMPQKYTNKIYDAALNKFFTYMENRKEDLERYYAMQRNDEIIEKPIETIQPSVYTRHNKPRGKAC